MKKTSRRVALLLVLTAQISLQHYGQTDFTWYNPVEQSLEVIEGQQWTEDLSNPFQRLPDRAQEQVRPPVWNLSKHAAGLTVRFKTEATNIVVRYQVSGNLAMPHMPATGGKRCGSVRSRSCRKLEMVQRRPKFCRYH